MMSHKQIIQEARIGGFLQVRARPIRWWLVALLCLAPSLSLSQSPPWYQSDFPSEEFKARWEQVFDRIGQDAVAVLPGVPQTNGFTVPRQTNNFYYLCGVETPGSYLLLDGRTRRVLLHLPPRDRKLESAEGRVLSADDAALAKRLIGVDELLSTERMKGDWLGDLPGGPPRVIFAQFSPAEGNAQSRGELVHANASIAADYWDGRLPREARFVELLRTRSGLGILEAMRSTKPGLYEYHLDAAARYVFLVNGARLEAYRSITASGTENIWNAHYFRNMSQLKDGDLVLMDYAPDYHYYVSDVGRMWPVNGRFSDWQRELVGFVLEYHKTILERIRPGKTPAQIMSEAKAAMEKVFAMTTFSKPVYEKAARRLVERGGGVFSHLVGMAVHDVGRYAGELLKPGLVFSVDPQLRVPEENLYIRYEDTVVVTQDGIENFTDFLPSELDDIETAMKEEGIVQKSPPQPAPPGQVRK
jgi:Xaa-Pro aminopeptidase